ncbi:hypothetical protein QR680_009854 [Steinernema hermaphroditum]|uniref:Uncharacterized protein n=1 Tax=Steinernema hermaphroditum TaxID=289476 RepID=A0AA39ILV7_9BILA|nr:hypothetical protein QR680_009854 [Steinernema hermaphroditum]
MLWQRTEAKFSLARMLRHINYACVFGFVVQHLFSAVRYSILDRCDFFKNLGIAKTHFQGTHTSFRRPAAFISIEPPRQCSDSTKYPYPYKPRVKAAWLCTAPRGRAPHQTNRSLRRLSPSSNCP